MDPKLIPTNSTSQVSDSIVITVAEVQAASECKNKQQQEQQKQQWRWSCYYEYPCCLILALLPKKFFGLNMERLIHSFKVGLALVLVSLLYMLEVVHDRLGDNAMWAVMTVVVVFESTAGATISKSLNRGMGTILGGSLGSLVALLAQEIGGPGKAVAIGTSVFIFGMAATYSRMAPTIKKKYDYGAMIFILTFSLISISGVRGDQIIKLASDRLSSITMGLAICVFISMFIFPVWAGDELRNSLASKFDKLAQSIEGLESWLKSFDENKGSPTSSSISGCLSLLCSRPTDESLANFAKWEPWHGRFGLFFPWSKYICIGELLQELAAYVLSLEACRESKQQSFQLSSTLDIKGQCETACRFLGCSLREIGDGIYNMKKCHQREYMLAMVQTMRLQLCSPKLLLEMETTIKHICNRGGGVYITNFVFFLVEVLDKLEALLKEVEELETVAGFSPE